MASIKISCVMLLVACLLWQSEGQLCDPACPEHWMLVGEYCYRYFGQPKKWHDAKDQCDGLEGELPSIHSLEENESIYSMWKALVNHPTTEDSAYWIGLHDTYQESSFAWSDNTEVDYKNWIPGQPDNNGGEDCVCVRNQGRDDFERQRWNDMRCENTQAFFCRKLP